MHTKFNMSKENLILPGIIISMSLILIATIYYPGGSQFDSTSIGYSWANNYISNLFSEKALNGANNTARFWAIGGMFFLSLSLAIFFAEFSKKISSKNAAHVIKYSGSVGMLFTLLIVTPWHDTMITIASTMFLVSMFYITIFVFKSRLPLFKLLCVIYLLVFYGTLYLYGSGDFREYLPITQKVLFVMTIVLILGLHFFTKKEDFQHAK